MPRHVDERQHARRHLSRLSCAAAPLHHHAPARCRCRLPCRSQRRGRRYPPRCRRAGRRASVSTPVSCRRLQRRRSSGAARAPLRLSRCRAIAARCAGHCTAAVAQRLAAFGCRSALPFHLSVSEGTCVSSVGSIDRHCGHVVRIVAQSMCSVFVPAACYGGL